VTGRLHSVIVFLLAGVSLLAQAPAPAPAYRPVESWGALETGAVWGEVPAVAVDASDNVLVLRRAEPPVLEFDRTGKPGRSWGQQLFVWPHGIRVDRDGFVWITDGRAADGRGQQVFKFDRAGTLLLTLGTRGVSGDGPDTFNGPCDVAVAGNGDIFVADGHVNARIVKFARDGTFIKAFGRKGTGDGELNVPHSLAIDSRGRVLVTDRGNHRVQVFDADGRYLAQWTGFGTMPDGIAIAADDTMYVADVGENGGITIASARDGSVRGRIPGARPEGIAVDGHDTIYAGETTTGRTLKVFVRH
jgi:DNA-binding beta-propeller fold protein YncE